MPKNHFLYSPEWKIAQRLYFSEEGKARTSRPAVRVALGGIMIGVMVMIVAICVVVGFKEEIQRKVAGLKLPEDISWSWQDFVNEMLDRAQERMASNGYFDTGKVTQVREEMILLDGYFSKVKPVAYLDDISTKNLLIHNGKVSGVIDIDWMGVGDNLTFIAMTYVALKNMDCETDYVDYLLEERGCTEEEQRAFLFYCMMFCVDFMGERGMQFGDKKIEVNDAVIDRLNRIYEELWEEYGHFNSKQ
jgi:hypothetical protein